jgi:hypothetical protein
MLPALSACTALTPVKPPVVTVVTVYVGLAFEPDTRMRRRARLLVSATTMSPEGATVMPAVNKTAVNSPAVNKTAQRCPLRQ